MKCLKNNLGLVLLIILFTSQSYSQERDSLDLAILELEKEFDEDTLSILHLIDSLLNVEDVKISELGIRFGYTSEVASIGREYGLDQYGLNPGLAYYHHSGIYADFSGYWNSDTDPRYNLTVASLGYLGSFNTNWTYNVSYDHLFYHESEEFTENPVSNALNFGTYYYLDFIDLGLDYSFLFGEESAHRLMPSLSRRIRLGRSGFLKNISVIPTAAIIFGDEDLTTTKFDANTVIDLLIDQLDLRPLVEQRFRMELAERNPEPEQAIAFLIELNQRRSDMNFDSSETILAGFQEQQNNFFGVLNYSLALPVSLKLGSFNLLFSYNYYFPQALPNEPSIPSYGFFRVTLSHNLIFNHSK